jgi:hypothetical protein
LALFDQGFAGTLWSFASTAGKESLSD